MKDKIHSAAAFTILALIILLLVAFFLSMNIILFGINVPVPSLVGPVLGVLMSLLIVSGVLFCMTDEH